MKTRLRKTARHVTTHRRFALRPLAFAICVGLSGAALALPQGGKVVSGDATIGRPDPNTEVIKQTTDKAIIDWLSFSIGAGEKVRFYQPSATSVTLNRVTGNDPSPTAATSATVHGVVAWPANKPVKAHPATRWTMPRM